MRWSDGIDGPFFIRFFKISIIFNIYSSPFYTIQDISKMAKRHLGLGKAAKEKAKKQKVEEAAEPKEASNELTVELNEEIDANDDFGQLKALWKTYEESSKENELVVNGIIHECDRMLRNDTEGKLNDEFHSIYAKALSSLSIYKTEDKEQVKQFFEASLERIELGLEKYAESISLLFAKSKILIDRIPLLIISQLTNDSKLTKDNNVSKLLDEALEIYEDAEKQAIDKKQFEYFNRENLEILQALDDLLDMIDNFGKEIMEGEESDEEDGEAEMVSNTLNEKHPLNKIRQSDKYNQWWRDHILIFYQNLPKETDEKLVIDICGRIGQSYLLEAELPMNIYTTIKYDEDNELQEIEGMDEKSSQLKSQELIKLAIEYLRKAHDSKEPDSWVNIAEALISLGNLYEIDSKEQEENYQEAEKILQKANNATNGKYEDILENLLNN